LKRIYEHPRILVTRICPRNRIRFITKNKRDLGAAQLMLTMCFNGCINHLLSLFSLIASCTHHYPNQHNQK
ncbi:MAG: hypothetical protein RJQ14_12300, partial [Marinoscillum sp.]